MLLTALAPPAAVNGIDLHGAMKLRQRQRGTRCGGRGEGKSVSDHGIREQYRLKHRLHQTAACHALATRVCCCTCMQRCGRHHDHQNFPCCGWRLVALQAQQGQYKGSGHSVLSDLLTSHSAKHQAGSLQRTMRCQDEVAYKENEDWQADHFSVELVHSSHVVRFTCVWHMQLRE